MTSELCEHFSKEWLAESESYYLTGVQKGIVGEKWVLGLLRGIKISTGLLNKAPVRLGNPYELQVTNDVPNILALGNEDTYLFDGWLYLVGVSHVTRDVEVEEAEDCAGVRPFAENPGSRPVLPR